jgi:hypothetical protein
MHLGSNNKVSDKRFVEDVIPNFFLEASLQSFTISLHRSLSFKGGVPIFTPSNLVEAPI